MHTAMVGTVLLAAAVSPVAGGDKYPYGTVCINHPDYDSDTNEQPKIGFWGQEDFKCGFTIEGRRLYFDNRQRQVICELNGALFGPSEKSVFKDYPDESPEHCSWQITQDGYIRNGSGEGCLCKCLLDGCLPNVIDFDPFCDPDGCLWEGADTFYGASFCGADTRWDPETEACVVSDAVKEDAAKGQLCGASVGTRKEVVIMEMEIAGDSCDCKEYCSQLPEARGWRFNEAKGELGGACACLGGKKLSLIPTDKKRSRAGFL